MQTPIDPLVAEMVEQLELSLQEDFQERAAIIEYDAKVQRAHAEALALLNVLERHPDVLTGVTILLVAIDGKPHFYMADSIDRAREHADSKKGNEIRATGLLWTLQEEFGGIA